MRYGVARGIFSNEAGLGSSAIAHCATSTKEPVRQAVWGVFEVFVDTIVVCTITALCLLVTGVVGTPDGEGGLLTGAALTIRAFSHGLGGYAGAFVSVSIALFAFTSILGWYHYGERSYSYLFGNRGRSVYKIIYLAAAFAGLSAPSGDRLERVGRVQRPDGGPESHRRAAAVRPGVFHDPPFSAPQRPAPARRPWRSALTAPVRRRSRCALFSPPRPTLRGGLCTTVPPCLRPRPNTVNAYTRAGAPAVAAVRPSALYCSARPSSLRGSRRYAPPCTPCFCACQRRTETAVLPLRTENPAV